MRTILFVLLCAAALCAKDDEKLKAVTRVSVDGEGAAAERARDYLRSGETCFILSDGDTSDATLEFSEHASDATRMGLVSIVGGTPPMSVVGAVVLRSGETIWTRTIPLHPRSGSIRLTVDYMIKQMAKKASCADRVLANKSEKPVPATGKNGDAN